MESITFLYVCKTNQLQSLFLHIERDLQCKIRVYPKIAEGGGKINSFCITWTKSVSTPYRILHNFRTCNPYVPPI